MKNKVFFPLLASLLMIGACVTTSCSNDDDQTAGSEQTENTVNLSQQFNNTVATLNEEMSGLDFDALAPLAAAVAENDSSSTSTNRQKFSAWLKEMLQLLRQDFRSKLPGGLTLGFRPIHDVLSMVWSVSSENASGKEDCYVWAMHGDSISITANYTARDSSVYHVTLEEKIERDILKLVVGRSKERKLTIQKGDELLLTIKTSREVERMALSIMPALSMEYTGEIAYKGYTISLGLGRAAAHERSIELLVNKAGVDLVKSATTLTDNVTLANILKHNVNFTADYNLSLLGDMILFNGKVNNINKLVTYAATILKLRTSGATEAECNEFAKLFNEIMTTNMSVIGTDVGNVLAASVFSDKLGKYVPSFVVISPLFGEEPVDINSMLSNLGFSIEDIMAMMKGEKTNGDDAVVID